MKPFRDRILLKVIKADNVDDTGLGQVLEYGDDIESVEIGDKLYFEITCSHRIEKNNIVFYSIREVDILALEEGGATCRCNCNLD